MRSFSKNPRRGIALIITVVLLAFLLILVLGMVSMVRVETSIAGNVQNQAVARQNAIMGLNLAIGQLQKFAGPDSSVTARSDIDDRLAVDQKVLTGVWLRANTTPTPDAYLVSDTRINGTTPDATVDDPTAAPAPDEVILVGSNSIGTAPGANAFRVVLQKSAIEDGTTTTGHYAYWVGDEGIKASIAQGIRNADITYDEAPFANYNSDTAQADVLRQLGLSRHVVDRAIGTGVFNGEAATGYPKLDLEKVVSRLQLPFVRDGANTLQVTVAEQRALFHDYTPLAKGVLADTTVANGRLRRDWSDASATGPASSGTQAALTPRAYASTLSTDANYRAHTVVARTGTVWPIASVAPTLTEVGIQFGYESTSRQLQYRIVAELWNPYASRIDVPANNLRVSVSLPAFTVDFKDSTNAVVHSVSIPAGPLSAVVDARVFQPGEIVRTSGGATLNASATSYAVLGTAVPATATPTAMVILAAAAPNSEITPTSFSLEVDSSGWTALQTYSGLPAFDTGTDLPLDPSSAGLGFELLRSLASFSDGAAAGTYDPRAAVFNAAGYYEPFASSNWLEDSSSNTALPGSGSPFRDGEVRILFDIPSQQVTNLAQLRHAIGTVPYALGSTQGSTLNNTFDESFLSSFPRTTAVPIDSNTVLANPYMEIFVPESGAPTLADLRNENRAARYLMIRGAFNVNSTSVEAWKAVLGGRIRNWSYNALGATANSTNLNAAFFRTPYGANNIDDLASSTPPVISTAGIGVPGVRLLSAVGRELTDAEVADLAARIVDRVKNHAGAGRVVGEPFRSLSQFVRSGAIDAAIRGATSTATTSLNNDITTADYQNSSSAALMQADVIAAIAQFMSVRSDTFVVRSYGDVVNPVTDAVEGRAWCEATVQRIPDLVRTAPAPTIADIMDPTAADTFGRRFKIVSFRWLSPDDI